MISLLSLLMAAAAEPALKCDDPQTQAEMNICAAEDYRTADVALNAQWAETSAGAKRADKAYAPKDGRPGYYHALLDAQRAWIKYRDLECRVEGYAMRGGSAESMMYSGCMARLTDERTKQLSDIAESYSE